MRPHKIQSSECEQSRISQQAGAIVSALAKLIAVELRPFLCEAMRDLSSPTYMSLRQAARAAHIRTAVMLQAVRLPPQHPGHLRSSQRSGSDARRFVSSQDLDQWISSGGMRAARCVSKREGMVRVANSGGEP